MRLALRWHCFLFAALFLFLSGARADAAPISMMVAGADVRTVMRSLARMANMSLVFDDSVVGTVSVNLEDEPENILRFVAETEGLTLSREGDVFLVTTAAKADAMRQMHVYPVRYGDPEELARVANLALNMTNKRYRITGASSSQRENADDDVELRKTENKGKTEKISLVIKNGAENSNDVAEERVHFDTATNSLIFFGTASEAQAVREVLSEIDKPSKQVSLEAKVVSLTKDASKNLGVTWEWSTLPQMPDQQHGRIDRNTGGKGYVPGVIRFGRGPEGLPFEFYYEARLNALVTDGKAKILARPNITTMQGREAVIVIGGEVPVPTETTTNDVTRTTYDYHQTGIILRCTPRVNANGEITASVETEVSTPYYVDTMKAYRFQDRRAVTHVRLADGETMVIGGLIGSEESRYMQKIPFLSDIPILGMFFKNVSHSHEESEVMIFLTAHVLKDT